MAWPCWATRRLRVVDCLLMTIREYLKERVSPFNRKCLPVSGLALLSAIYSRGNVYLGALTVLMVFGAIATFVVFMRQTHCPRCSMPLGNVALHWRSNRLPAPRCLHCAVGIDEPMKPGSPS
jgi:hypothetical protein